MKKVVMTMLLWVPCAPLNYGFMMTHTDGMGEEAAMVMAALGPAGTTVIPIFYVFDRPDQTGH